MVLLIDTDAFLCLRKWDFLILLRHLQGEVALAMTGYVARHELKDVQDEVASLEECGLLVVHDIKVRTPGYVRFKKLLKKGADKGEAESVAWAQELPSGNPKPVFVSQDGRARRMAKHCGLEAVDMFGIMVQLHELDLVAKCDVQARLASWDDNSHLACQPKDFTRFDDTWQKRVTSRQMRTGLK